MMKLPRYRTIDDLEHGTDSAIHTARQRDKDNRNDKPYRAWLYGNGAPYIPSIGHTHREGTGEEPSRTNLRIQWTFPQREKFLRRHTGHTQATVPAAEHRVSAACRWAGSVCRTEDTTRSRQGVGHTWTPEGAGQTGPPATLPAAVGNFVRKPCAVKGLNKMDASPARFPELEQCAYRIAITCMDDDKKEQDTSSRHILPDFTGFWRVVLEAEYRFGGSRTSNLTQDQWPAKTRHLHPEGDVVHIIVPSTEYRTWREGGETRRKQRIAITWPAYATIAT